MSKIIKRSLLLVLSLCFVLSLGCFAFFSSAKAQQVKADSEYDADAFEMYNGASVGVYKDGLRFIVKMGRDVYQEILDDDNITLSFLVAPKSYFDAVDEGANPGKYENLSNKVKIDVDKDKIYINKSYYYANGVLTNLDHNNRSSGSQDQYDYEFVAVAIIKDSTGVKATRYASFAGGNRANNTRTQYNVLQAAILNDNVDTVKDLLNTSISPYKTWFGGNAHPLIVDTVAKYDRYEELRNDEGCDFSSCTVQARTPGEELTTAFMSDKEIALKQFYDNRGCTASYTTDKHWGDEEGSIKFTFTALSADVDPYIYYKMLDSTDEDRMSGAYNSRYSDKYVAFNVYNDTTADYIEVFVDNGWSGFRIPRCEWRTIVWPADGLWRNNAIVIKAFEYSDTDIKPYGYGSGTEPTRVPINGDVYFSKATVVNYDDVENVLMMTKKGTAPIENDVLVGHTNITKAYWITIGDTSDYVPDSYANKTSAVSKFYGEVAYVAGSLMAYGVSYAKLDYALGIFLKTPVAFAGNVMYITMKGGNAGEGTLFARCVGSGGSVDDSYGCIVETYDDGYVKYAFPFGQNKYNHGDFIDIDSYEGNLTNFYLYVLRDYNEKHIDEIYIKDIEFKSLTSAAANVRAVEGSNTVFMFDNALGAAQLRSNYARITYTTDMHMQGENGSTKITLNNQEEPWFNYLMLDATDEDRMSGTYNEQMKGKYVVFYAYNDTNADIMDIAEYTVHRSRLHKGEWTMVVWPADILWRNQWFAIFNPANYSGSGYESTTITGNIYLSKAVLLGADEIYEMPTSDADDHIAIGSMSVDSIFWVYHGDYNPNSGAFNSPTYSDIYYVDGALRFLAIPSSSANTPRWNGVKFYMQTSVYRKDNKLYVVAKGLDENAFVYGSNEVGQLFDEGPHAVKEQTLADGFELYSFDISQIGTDYETTKSAAFAIVYPSLLLPHMREIVIKDMWFASQRNTVENAVDFFVDVEAGRDIKVLQITDTQIIDSSTAREDDVVLNDATQLSSYRNTEFHDSMDVYCFKYLRELITETQPDFIIMTGDNIYGRYDDDGHILTRLIEFMEGFGIPWSPVMGNHDAEAAIGVDWQCEQFEKAEHCLFKQRTLTGNGNYTVGIRQGGELKRLFVMLDSNGYSDNVSAASMANEHTTKTRGFGDDQIEWYTNAINAVKTAVPSVKISFVCHIQMKRVFDDLRAKYGEELFPANSENVGVSIDALNEGDDFGFVGETGSKTWPKETETYNGMVALGVDSIFLGHSHLDASSVVNSDGIRVQFGLKSSRHDYLMGLFNKKYFLNTENVLFYLDSDNGDSRFSPLIGGSVMTLGSDGAINDAYNYYCTGAGKGLDPATWVADGS